MANAIEVKNLRKTFRLPHDKSTTLKHRLINFRKQRYENLKALDGVSFNIKKGEFFGIIGRNGSGKSTLLKILAGIYQPTSGSVNVNGRLTPFIELGVGFDPELTGKDNVFLNGAILGLTRQEIVQKYDEIVAFAELGKFMDQKLKNYSSGMQVRLAFAIAIQAHNEILLIDEVLAVGDAAFQQKSLNEFKKIKESGRTVVFVSHDMSSVKTFCDRSVLIERGKIVHLGSPSDTIAKYAKFADKSLNLSKSKAVSINEVSLIGENGKKLRKINFGDSAIIQAKLTALKKHGLPSRLVLGIAIFDETYNLISGPNTGKHNIPPAAKKIEYKIQKNLLNNGRYFVHVSLYDGKENLLDHITDAVGFEVTGAPALSGKFDLNGKWVAS